MKISYENMIFISAIYKTDNACLNICNNVLVLQNTELITCF